MTQDIVTQKHGYQKIYQLLFCIVLMDLRFLKAAMLIVESRLLSLMTTFSRLEHSAKAEELMTSTESGRMTVRSVLLP